MVATDGSESAGRAVDVAAKLAKTFASELLIVTVGGNLSYEDMRQLERAEGNIGEALDMLSNQILRAAKTQAERIGVDNIRLESAWGDPTQSIIDAAARGATDALVVGRRGRGQLAGLLLGSVS
jgi:nucleotide-binding universal stress UspA family protein